MFCQNSELAYDVEAKWCREEPHGNVGQPSSVPPNTQLIHCFYTYFYVVFSGPPIGPPPNSR